MTAPQPLDKSVEEAAREYAADVLKMPVAQVTCDGTMSARGFLAGAKWAQERNDAELGKQDVEIVILNARIRELENKCTMKMALEQEARIKELESRIESLESCLRFGHNEMKYRLFQIEGSYNIPMVGEMYKFISWASKLLNIPDSSKNSGAQ